MDRNHDLNKLEGNRLPFIDGPHQHTILSFNFGGNEHLAVFVEPARTEEEYSTTKVFPAV
jgi:hypothetical protein